MNKKLKNVLSHIFAVALGAHAVLLVWRWTDFDEFSWCSLGQIFGCITFIILLNSKVFATSADQKNIREECRKSHKE